MRVRSKDTDIFLSLESVIGQAAIAKDLLV